MAYNPELMNACENFFESWFGAPLGQPEHMDRILERRKETKKEFAEILYKFVSLWQKESQ